MTELEKNLKQLDDMLKAGVITPDEYKIYKQDVITSLDNKTPSAEVIKEEVSAPLPPPPAPPPPVVPPPAPEIKFHVSVNGVNIGSFERDVIIKKIKSKEFKKDAMVWKDGMPEWVSASEHSEFKKHFPAEPPPPPSGPVKGKLTYTDGSFYEGDVENGKANGKGKLTFSDGGTYVGDFVNNLFCGKGVQKWVSGAVGEGDYSNGKRHGYGKVKYSNGNIYEGYYIEGKRTGTVKILFPNGDVYDGDLADDKPHGFGKYTWSDGEVYEGYWVKNKQEGSGKVVSRNGDIIKIGSWKEGKFIG